MPDQFSADQRSRVMRAVKSGDTTPEWIVRRLVHAMGYRYRLGGRGLPGRPDLVLPRLGKAIFVHGCFWHRHACRSGQSMPASRVDYWQAKFARNVLRDRANLRKLRRLGWSVLVVWECQTSQRKRAVLEQRLRRFLEQRSAPARSQ
ncbi:MAG: very short patch repair endonuclease [Planctomycetota bacterium]|nr:MAG: very short patch repair endonuclease [Planctomycetota bacterium]